MKVLVADIVRQSSEGSNGKEGLFDYHIDSKKEKEYTSVCHFYDNTYSVIYANGPW